MFAEGWPPANVPQLLSPEARPSAAAVLDEPPAAKRGVEARCPIIAKHESNLQTERQRRFKRADGGLLRLWACDD
jgi:hypothetical protein